jgi:MFS transporter, PAT family, beta-lactamase induction signal transducer AmpG
MNRSMPLRYPAFALLYFAEGAILSYFTSLNAIYLLSFHLTMSQVGLFSAIAVIPMILKVFIGMISDKVNLFGMGHRKPYIVIGLLLQTSGILVFPYIDPVHSFGWMVLVGFLVVSGMALYDTCTDGFALDTTPREDEGKVQGIMVAGRALGVVMIAGLLGIISSQVNWSWVFLVLASMSLLPLPLVLFLKEPARSPEAKFNWNAFRILRRRDIIALGMLGALFTLITNGSNELVNPFLRESFGISYMMAGFYTAIWGVGVILGGLTGGKLTDRFGDRRSLTGAMLTAFASVTILASITGPAMAWPLVFLFGIAYGYYETAFFATSMAVTDIRIAASMFSILMAMANIGSSIGMVVSGSLSDMIGFRWTFAILGFMNLMVLPLLPMIFRKSHTAG